MKVIISVLLCLFATAFAIEIPAVHLVPTDEALALVLNEQETDQNVRKLSSPSTPSSSCGGRCQKLRSKVYTDACIAVYDRKEILTNETYIWQLCSASPRFRRTEYYQLKCNNCKLWHRRRELKSGSYDDLCLYAFSETELQYRECVDYFEPRQMFYPIMIWDSDEIRFLNEEFNQYLSVQLVTSPLVQTITMRLEGDLTNQDGFNDQRFWNVGDREFLFHRKRDSFSS